MFFLDPFCFEEVTFSVGRVALIVIMFACSSSSSSSDDRRYGDILYLVRYTKLYYDVLLLSLFQVVQKGENESDRLNEYIQIYITANRSSRCYEQLPFLHVKNCIASDVTFNKLLVRA